MRSHVRLLVSLATLALLVPASAFATTPSAFDHGAAPKGPADDTRPSMGVFRIVVDPAWQPWFNANLGSPFWDGTSRLTSPVLYDNNTTIGRSFAHTQGSALDVNGASVGVAGTLVKDGDMIFPPGYNSNNPSRYEVHTEVYKLNLTTGPGCRPLTTVCTGLTIPVSVTGGSGNSLLTCPGEIEANGVDGFPAKSFFDVFVTVDIGSGFGGFGPIANNPSDPLLVTHNPIGAFPPQVVYIHENPVAVPVYFTSGGNTGLFPGPDLYWNQGDRFGYLVLAGHAADLSCNDSTVLNCEQFWNQVTSGKEMCLPGSVPGIGEWGTVALATTLLLAGLWVVTRRRRTSLA